LTFEQLESTVRAASAGDDRGIWQRLVDSKHPPDTDAEAAFVDAVSRNLQLGRFLLLVVGDGIRSDLLSLGDLLASQPSLGFHLELVEVQLFGMPGSAGDLLVVPRVVGATQEVTRAVVEVRNPERAAVSVSVEVPSPETPPSGRFGSVDEFIAAMADNVGEAQARAAADLVEWWQRARSGVVKLNKTSVNLSVPYSRSQSRSVSVMTLYANGRAVGSVEPMAEWRGIIPADDALARFQAAGFDGDPGWPEQTLDCTQLQQRERVEQLLAWADELIRHADRAVPR
jgi:hypothetical protein